MIKKFLIAASLLFAASPAVAGTYDFNFTFTNPGTVMQGDGLGVGTRTFSGKFSYDDTTGTLSFLSGTYGNANGSMTLGPSDVTSVVPLGFSGGATPTLNIFDVAWNSTLPGSQFDDFTYEYTNNKLTWDNGTGAGQFEVVSNSKTTFLAPPSAPEINGASFALAGFVFLVLIAEAGVRTSGERRQTRHLGAQFAVA